MKTNFYALTTENALKELKSTATLGLSTSEAKERLVVHGLNQLQEKEAVHPLSLFIDQFKDFIVWILIGAAVVSGFLNEMVDAVAIISIVVLNAILGFVQEYRAEKSLAALKKLSSPVAKVLRDGQHAVIPSAQLVPGDIVDVEAGDGIPADGRIIWVSLNFTVQEASLTGESSPVAKTNHELQEKEIPLGDRANMVYMGTSVSTGKAKVLIVDTGMKTELGKIAGLVQSIEAEVTPLQKKLEEFGKNIVTLCFILVGLVFILEWWRGGKLLEVFMTAVSLAVAAIPEGLTAVVTIALALGVNRMVKRNALIRKLPSVETLGCVTVICSDKTGTLTRNEMTVQRVYTNDQLIDVTGIGYAPTGNFAIKDSSVDPLNNATLKQLLLSCTLCNGAELIESAGVSKIVGDPTEGALLTLSAKAKLNKKSLEAEYPFVDEIPFDSQRKKMSVIRQHNNDLIVFTKGAPDVLLKDCTTILRDGKIQPLTQKDHDQINKTNNELANEAMRVLAVAYKTLDKNHKAFDVVSTEKDLVFVGLIAMIDPPRDEVRTAMASCKKAGIKTVMLTGDHKNTAIAIAKSLGFFNADSLALSGEELDKINDDDLFHKVKNIVVYARVSPEHKLRVVRAWRKHGEIVAMTGDGVNDAPAVKEADIGIAMGITGTDVTKEVSDMVITDDNFASIVSAVEEGRGIYNNIKKFVHYLLSCNAGEILTMFIASLLGFPPPLLPIHILWVNLVTDGFPALALGFDPVDSKIMERSPRRPDEPIITKERGRMMLIQGFIIALCSLAAFTFILFIEKEGLTRARTGAFVVLACSQLFHSYNCRSATESLFKLGIFSNKKLILATFVSFVLQMAVVYLPFCQRIFKTEALGWFDWILVIVISSLPLWIVEINKSMSRRKDFKS